MKLLPAQVFLNLSHCAIRVFHRFVNVLFFFAFFLPDIFALFLRLPVTGSGSTTTNS